MGWLPSERLIRKRIIKGLREEDDTLKKEVEKLKRWRLSDGESKLDVEIYLGRAQERSGIYSDSKGEDE